MHAVRSSRAAMGEPRKTGKEAAIQFRKEKFLGKGSFGNVFVVTRLTDGALYALKVSSPFVHSAPAKSASGAVTAAHEFSPL